MNTLFEQAEQELAIYHGGFMSPQKPKFFTQLAQSALHEVVVRFWSDIDLSGFQMFNQMISSILQPHPIRMTGPYEVKYHGTRLPRSGKYL